MLWRTNVDCSSKTQLKEILDRSHHLTGKTEVVNHVSIPPNSAAGRHAASEGERQTHHQEAVGCRLLLPLRAPLLLPECPLSLQTAPTGEAPFLLLQLMLQLSVTHQAVLQETLRELQEFIRDAGDTVSQAADSKSHDAAAEAAVEACEDPPSKRAKLEPDTGEAEGDTGDAAGPRVCVACLGVLQELSDASQAKKIAEAVKAETYEFDSLVLSVSLPAQLCVREVSLN